MKAAIHNCRWIFVLLIGVTISGLEMTSGSRQGSASVSDDSPAAVSQTFTVTTTTDGTGAGTLRTAITSANANPGLDTIAFNISGSGVQTLPITSALPDITDSVIIDGTTQPGYAGTPLIRLSPGASGIASVINVTGGGSTVKALSFASFSGVVAGNGVIKLASNNNIVTACASGTGSGNTQVYITGANNRVGGSVTADRNFFYGNTSSRENVVIFGAAATGNRVVGNVFGTTPAGVRQTNSGINILIDGAPNNFVGGSAGTTPGGACTGECNLISGSDSDGVRISGATATGNTVIGNFVGLAADGLNVNRNGNYGVHILNAPNNTVGGTSAGERNVIAANSFGSVFVEGTGNGNVITGNYVGLKSTGADSITGTFNVPAFGIQLNSNSNRVGGVTAGERNIITGSNRGIIIGGNSNLVQGNFIGTDVTGSFALTTQLDGVVINGANNTIGGTAGTTLGGACTGACNLISGNGQNGANNGLVITGSGATGNVVDGNYIGLNAAGTAAIRNGNPQFGIANAILIFNANNNIIGRVPAGSTSPNEDIDSILAKSLQPSTLFCIQNERSGSYFKFDDVTGAFELKNCLSGEINASPPLASGRINHSVDEIRFDYDDAVGRMEFRIYPSDRRGDGFNRIRNNILGDEFFRDLNIDDNGSCVCPGIDKQSIVGTVRIGGGNGSSGNVLSYLQIGTSSNGQIFLGNPAESGVVVESGTNNQITLVDVDTRDVPSVVCFDPNITTVMKNNFLTTNGVKPISAGNPNPLTLNFIYLSDGTGNLSGTLPNQMPNTTFQIDVYGVHGQEIGPSDQISSQFSGYSFQTVSNANGMVEFNKQLTSFDVFPLIHSQMIQATVTQILSGPIPPENPNAPRVIVYGGTSEMSQPIATPGVTVSGRVTTPAGAGLRNATVSITDNASGVRRTATTSSFGFYSFENVAIDRTYTIRVSSRLYRFTPRTEYVSDNLLNVDMAGQE